MPHSSTVFVVRGMVAPLLSSLTQILGVVLALSIYSSGNMKGSPGNKVRQSGYFGGVDRTRIAHRHQRSSPSAGGLHRFRYGDNLAVIITPSVTL